MFAYYRMLLEFVMPQVFDISLYVKQDGGVLSKGKIEHLSGETHNHMISIRTKISTSEYGEGVTRKRGNKQCSL